MSAEPLDRQPLPLLFSTSEPTPPIEFSGPAAYPADVLERLRPEADEILARYPQSRSALLPLLHLVQSVDGYLTRAGVAFCADRLRLTTAQVASVATFYTMYRMEPTGDYLVGVCTNTLCAVMGGDAIAAGVSEKLGVESGQTTDDGTITYERIECNAACDHAPVVMVNWEFFDEQTPESVDALVDDLRAGSPPAPSRGSPSLCTFRQTARLLAGLPESGDAP